ncbi:MAG: hypothetical protein R3B40_16190 [Polyangiales bacterium]|nr:hypothetical protein [Myxococcales bacterium]MCB9661618.1 hypothetical protein [Sandaracinaceae bacterium]
MNTEHYGAFECHAFVGVVPLRPETPCLSWSAQAELRMVDAEPGLDTLTIRR